jgi:Protein of unknown function (DUF2867)
MDASDLRLPNAAHTSRPWRIHELTRDFRIEDVWALPTRGGAHDFSRLVELMSSFDPSRTSSTAVRALFAVRSMIGQVLGLDKPEAGLGSRVPALRGRLPADLRDARSGPGSGPGPFTPLYLTGDEWALEIANQTVHGVLHLGWVPDGAGGYRGQMAVLVKPNGLLGIVYMAAITPFRRLIVYPLMMRSIGEAWQGRVHVRQVAVPPALRSLSTLAHVDYADAFLVETGGFPDRTAERWARAVLQDAPLAVRHTLLSGWSAIGLKVGRGRADRSVLGWEIRRSDPDLVLLRAGSHIGMPGELLFKRERRGLLFATFVQHDNALARATWAAVEPVHVPTVRYVLEQAARREDSVAGTSS